MLLAESLKALGGLGILSLGGKYLIRRIFEVFYFINFLNTSLYVIFNQLLMFDKMIIG